MGVEFWTRYAAEATGAYACITAVYTVIVLITAFYIGRQVRAAQDSSHASALARAVDRLHSFESVEARRYVVNQYRNQKVVGGFGVEQQRRVTSVCSDFDYLGMLVQHKYIPESVVLVQMPRDCFREARIHGRIRA